MRKLSIKILMVALGALLCLMPFIGCAEAPRELVVLAELPWESARVNNCITSFILQHGYGYESEVIPGETIPLWQGLRRGDIDVQLEAWPRAQKKAYEEAIAAGEVVSLGPNYATFQGWWVPTYVIKGDAARGIEPMAPDLKTIDDLPKYWELFKDPEDPSKGCLYSGVVGWEAEKTTAIKFETYGLDQYYNMFRPGSDAAQVASMVAAYQKGEPWLGYYWAPSWPLGKLDMTRIPEPVPFDEDIWEENRGCEWPAENSEVCVNADWLDRAPQELVEFFSKFETTSDHVSAYLVYTRDYEAEPEETAIWFFKEYESVWTQWVPADVANKVKAALP